MSLSTRFQKDKTEPGEQTCPESETGADSQTAGAAGAETNSELDAWVKRMLEKSRELDAKDPGWYERAEKFWRESGELEKYLEPVRPASGSRHGEVTKGV